MSQTLTEKLLHRGATGVTFEGSEWFEVQPDRVLGHDATMALLVDAHNGRSLAHPERLFLVADHFALDGGPREPPPTIPGVRGTRRHRCRGGRDL